MLVIAFDGILFDTLPARAHAVRDALAAEKVLVGEVTVETVIPARSIAEAVRAAVGPDFTDETTIDLATIRAERALADIGAHAAVLNVAVRDRLKRAAAVTRIVIRADSRRAEVERLLALADLESSVSFVRCSDDQGSAHDHHSLAHHAQAAPASSAERSYWHIAKRMYANSSLLGGPAGIGVALELDETARAVARAHGFTTPENFESASLPAH